MSILNDDQVHVSAYIRNRNGLPEYVCEHYRSWPSR